MSTFYMSITVKIFAQAHALIHMHTLYGIVTLVTCLRDWLQCHFTVNVNCICLCNYFNSYGRQICQNECSMVIAHQRLNCCVEICHVAKFLSYNVCEQSLTNIVFWQLWEIDLKWAIPFNVDTAPRKTRFWIQTIRKVIWISHKTSIRINQFGVSAPSRCRKFTTKMQLNELYDPSGIC